MVSREQLFILSSLIQSRPSSECHRLAFNASNRENSCADKADLVCPLLSYAACDPGTHVPCEAGVDRNKTTKRPSQLERDCHRHSSHSKSMTHLDRRPHEIVRPTSDGALPERWQTSDRLVGCCATGASSSSSSYLTFGARDVWLHLGGVRKLEGVLEHVAVDIRLKSGVTAFG